MVVKKPKHRKGKVKKDTEVVDPNRIPIGLLPTYFRESNRVYIGCDSLKRRIEMDLCIYKRCKQRTTCPQFLLARKMKEDLGMPILDEVKRHRVEKRKRKRRIRKRGISENQIKSVKPRERNRKRKRERRRND